MPPRMIALYALATMEKEGSVHGYRLAERIAEKTGGAWRPGAGTIYPALNRLTSRGLARVRTSGRRRIYSMTPKGRALLTRIRSRRGGSTPRAPDLTALWAEVAGAADVRAFLLLRLRRSLDAIDAALSSGRAVRSTEKGKDGLRAEAIRELSTRLERLRRSGRGAIPGRAPRAGRRP